MSFTNHLCRGGSLRRLSDDGAASIFGMAQAGWWSGSEKSVPQGFHHQTTFAPTGSEAAPASFRLRREPPLHSRIHSSVFLLLLLFFACCITESFGQSLSKEELARVDFEQRLGAVVPLDASFTDEHGTPARLGSFFNERPVILALVYYDCPNLCTVVLNGLLESVSNLRADAGKEFDVVVVSIRPDDSTELAAKKKQAYFRRYGRSGTANGWHFLTGGAESIRQLAEAVGFHYTYDPHSAQFAHASGIVVLTPQGKVSRYLLGIEYPPKELRQALTDASKNEVGTLARRLLLLCFHYDPNTGRYTLIVRRVLQAASAGTMLLLAGMIVHFARLERKRKEDGSV